MKADYKDSYIYLGRISEAVKDNTTYINAATLDSWAAELTDSFFSWGEGQEERFAEFRTKALFEPQVDYLYVKSAEFVKHI